ncbi:serine hydrolase [Polaribacter dokdonensis]|jgi:CubicO group peptidase (beta-lactamase class C family)|uniref:Beta-lactamase n=1 Tax=Polaribacter dokdonensis DSW-5 TaxID=1300348 RepID=A0A0M9CIA7_9FLAO|nr:serine hydrolase [Polaribacter dokdonensis]KOY53102.1 Beta-lactamase [Polaribacter dokdonensis DSW-5]SEE57169.1 CubicO group peptidase, beta-lactamase class C family [Polaribacter dokdonensis DSW-5]
MNNYFTSILFFFITYIGFSQSYQSKIDAVVSSTYSSKEPGISVLVAKDRKAIYSKAFGKSNLELNTPLETNSVFQIGSITKQFTAISILMLEEQGKLSVEDKIGKYISEYAEIGKDITIHHLLNHTSGIKNRTPVGDKGFISKTNMSPTELIAYFKDEPLEFKPGERFKYSNAGYILLGRIIEIVSGQPYSDFIEQNIFDKIGMKNSSCGDMKQVIPNLTKGYIIEQNDFVKSDYINLSLAYSAGAILSTTEDLLKWQNALLSNTLLKASSIKQAMTPTLLNSGKRVLYGYGFRFSKLGNSPVIAHTGSTKGFTSIALFLPKEKLYITALTNCNCKNVNNVAKQVAELFVNLPDNKITEVENNQPERKSIDVPSEILSDYTGTYEVKPNVNLTIGLDNTNQLYLLAPGQTKKVELFAETQNHFFVKIVDAEITFNTNEKGKVISLTMNQSGRKITAKKN